MKNILISYCDDEPLNLQFSYPRISEKDYNQFYDIVELSENGDHQKSIVLLQQLVMKYPEFVDAWTHIGFAHQSIGNTIDCISHFTTAVYLCKSSLPSDFNQITHKILWNEGDNRPFLRACHALGLEYQNLEMHDDALNLYLFILDVNPDDNQGVRELVCECYLGLKQYKKFIAFYNKHRSGSMTGMDISYALALIASGKTVEAESWIKASAVRYSNLWKELIKKTHRKPKNPMFDLGFVTSSGVDAAYSYWNRYNKYWLQVEGSLDYVRQAISEKSVKK
ncbi:MAG: hypothetical protein PHU69_14285 [Fermentimonas sp.]|nr:hypothetical protein [Fermentimonas sp.]